MNILKNEEFTIGHYKGRWVWIPLLHVPEEAKTPNGFKHFSFTPQNSEESIEPIEKSLSKWSCDLAYKKIKDSICETIHPEQLNDKEVKKLALSNDLPLSWLTSRFPARCYASHNARRNKFRKHKAISSANFFKLIYALEKIHLKLAVALEIVWYHNDLLGEGGGYVTLEEVLRAKLSDLHCGLGTQSLSLSRSGKGQGTGN